MPNPSRLQPTFEGFVASTFDSLILFEACLSGELPHVPRRPHDRERPDLIRSGSVFVYEEHASGIKRWTDGVSWSPSRILGNFLVYRELDRPFGPGEKKRAVKRQKGRNPNGVTKPNSARRGRASSAELTSSVQSMTSAQLDDVANLTDDDRAFVGSLLDSYPFKQDGLVKKTISISLKGVPHHIVSYFTLEDVKEGRLATPSKHQILSSLTPRSDLILGQSFRTSVEEVEFPPERANAGLLEANNRLHQEYIDSLEIPGPPAPGFGTPRYGTEYQYQFGFINQLPPNQHMQPMQQQSVQPVQPMQSMQPMPQGDGSIMVREPPFADGEEVVPFKSAQHRWY